MGTSPVHASDGVSDVSWSTSDTVQVYDIDENRVRSIDPVTLTESGEYEILLNSDFQGGHPWEPWLSGYAKDTDLKFRMEIGETNLERGDADTVGVRYGIVDEVYPEFSSAYLESVGSSSYFVSSGDTLNDQLEMVSPRIYKAGNAIAYAVRLEDAEFNKGPFGFGDNDRTTIKNIRVTQSYEGQNVEQTYSFSVSSNQIQSTTGSATLSFNHEATSAGDPESNPLQIDINGNTVYSNTPVSGDVITTSFDPSVLNEGDNTVRVYVDEATGTDDSHDDYGYEITDVSVDVPTDGDYDDDGLYNWKESQIGTDPTEKDTDGDGLDDSAEVADYGTDPTEKDTDGDGLDDQKEVNDSPTDPTEKDTDDDGVDDSSDDAPVTPEDKDGYQDNDGVPENPPPTVSLTGISVTEGQQQTLSADANDPEGKSLNYEWSLNGPGRLTGNGEEVVYKAPSSPDGITRGRTADVTVTVTTTGETRGQSEKSATATAQVDLEDVNPTPSVSLPDKQLSEGGTITIRASANNPEDDGISYQWSKDGPGSLSSSGETATYTAPSDISESVSTSVSVTVTEPQGRSASASATVSVKNNQGDDDTDGDGILNQNDEAPNEPEDKDGYQDSDGDPENPPPTVSLTGISVTEGQQQTLSADANDPEGKSLNYEWSLNGPGRLTGNGEEVVYKAPSSPDGITRGRTADVTVTVTTTGETRGQSEKSATATAQVDLEDVNPTPSVSLLDKQLSEGGTITIRASANNPEDDGISYQWSKDGPGSLSSSGETATYTAPSDISESVSTSVSVTVTEPQGRSASASATVSVKNNQGDDDTDGDGILNQNDEAPNEPEDKDGYQDSDGDPENPPPTVSLAGMSVTEGQQQTLSADASDPEGDSLNYEWVLSGAGQLSTTSGQSITYTAPSDISLNKSATVSVTVTEPDSGKSSQAEATISIPDNPDPAQFDIAISNTNNPPAGEQLEVTAEITNTGEQTGQATVQLDTTAGAIEGTQTTVDLAGGESTTEPLTVDTTGVDPGSYTATVTASAATGTGTGTDENPGDAASFEIAAAPAEFQLEFLEGPTQIITGESYSPTVEVTNNGAGAGTQDISYVLENPDGLSTGIEAVEPSVELAAGESEQITFDFEAQETDALSTGTYNHVFKSADDESVREVELEAGFSIAQFDRNDTGQIEFDDLRYATREYNRENITFDQLRRVLRAYNTDQQV